MNRMYFADNQQKQKAFDRYYNSMAKSHFKQGRKLRAMINQEAADEALTEKMAALYASSTSKQHDYEYDEVSKKLQKKVFKPKKQSPEAPVGRFAKKVRDRTNAESYSPPEDELPFRDTHSGREGFESFKSEFDPSTFFESDRNEYFKEKSYGDAKKIAQRTAEKYVSNYQKKARQDKFNSNRVMSKDEEAEATAYAVKELMAGHKHKRSASEDSTRNGKIKKKTRPAKTSKPKASADESHDVADETDLDEPEEKMTPEQFKADLKRQNPTIRATYQNIVNSDFLAKKHFDRQGLYEKVRYKFRAQYDLRAGNGAFVRDIPQPPSQKEYVTKQTFDSYAKILSTKLDQVFA